MKRGTEAKVKFKMLQRALNMETWQVRGLLDSIWEFAATNAPAGDIGRHTDDEIAIGIGFGGEIGAVIEALVKTKWLDRHDEHGLVIHDWPEHCENSVHASIARKRLLFCDGSKPNLAKLSKQERPAAQAYYDSLIPPQAAGGSRKPPKAAVSSLPEPCHAMPKPAPKPMPSHAGSEKQVAGVFSKLGTEDLKDPARLQSWYEHATTQRKPVISHSEHNRVMVFAAAERALEEATDRPPVGLFAWLVSNAKWEFITHAQEERAAQKIGGLCATGPPDPLVRQLASTMFKPLAANSK